VTQPAPLRMKEISRFFFPLLLNVQLMSLSHSIINASLARLDDYVTALAAFSVAMILHLFVASPSYQNHTITIAMVRGRRSRRSTLLFVLLVAGYVSLMLYLLAYTPVGSFVLVSVLGVDQAIADGAREVLGILMFLPFFTGLRGFFQGLVIRARRTGLVSSATGIRVGALLLLLFLGRGWFAGASLGAFALLGCIVIETAFMAWFARRVALPADGFGERSTAQIFRYAFPLAYSSCLQQTIPLVINAILGRLPDAPLALAAFGIIRGFLFLLAGPMRNLQQAYLTLVHQETDYRVLIRFFYRTSLGMGLITLLVAWPLNALVLGRIMGIAPGLRDYLSLPLAVCAIFPLLYGAANLLRGYFAGTHQTTKLGYSTLLKLLFVIGCYPLFVGLELPFAGIVIGIFMLLSAELVEAGYLRQQRRRQLDSQNRLVPG
jgi:progressive ankylosis protein